MECLVQAIFMEELTVLVLLGIVWLISSKRWRRRFLTSLILTVAVCLLMMPHWGVFLATQGLLIGLPPDSGKPVQAIVVLGRGDALRQRRLETVEQLWQQQRAPKIFMSGMLDAEFMVEQKFYC